MKKIYLFRYQRLGSTCGYLLLPGRQMLRTLEPPDLNNRRNKSCIPVGEYEVSYVHRSPSGKYKRIYYVHDVKDRSGILIHIGNLPAHTRGCILPGLKAGVYGSGAAVWNSGVAMKKIRDAMGKQTFLLRIIE